MEPAEKLTAIANAVQALRDLDKTSLEKDHKDAIKAEILQCLKQLKIIQFKQQTYRPQGELQDEILEALDRAGQATSAELAELTDHEPNPINSTMTRLKRQGLVHVVEMIPNPDYGKGSGRRAEKVALYERVETSIKPGRKLGSLQQQIVEALVECGTGTPPTIAEMIERDNQAVYTALARLKKQGVIRIAKIITNPKCGRGQPAKIPVYQLADSYQELFIDEPDDEEP
ncbi:winged helix-turn-helix transcriptional regulator [Laspinema sp. A4]|uniref:winged helix-turn-helix transcriptional regulator n=1 Tax=Laspinema sp. D2d TaxID=2953686 RepID=UPI0021BB976E|nr:winged helix-turn-helix transcriptional regulator [Laspinema sp. D2d]MCT7986455.1 winged helix-turn-helix transcriptional regulator [Laspinema sp. D2d]